MKRQVVIELEVPEDFDACWNDNTGIQAAHDIVVRGILELSVRKVLDIEKSKDKQYAAYLQKHQDVRDSLKIVGHVDDKGKLHDL
jgi:hypothetical protein